MLPTCLALGLSFLAGTATAENASNPLAAVSNVDLRWQSASAHAGDRHDAFIDGAHMVLPVLKLRYELHYNFTRHHGVVGERP